MFMPQLLLHWKQYGCSISGKLRLITMYNSIQDSFKNKKLNKTRKNEHSRRNLYWYSKYTRCNISFDISGRKRLKGELLEVHSMNTSLKTD